MLRLEKILLKFWIVSQLYIAYSIRHLFSCHSECWVAQYHVSSLNSASLDRTYLCILESWKKANEKLCDRHKRCFKVVFAG